MVNLESAKLVLRTNDIVAPNVDTLLTNFTWKNIDLKTVLGPMYDKYDLFNFYLTNITYANNNNEYGNTDNDITVSIFINGLSFVNQTYSFSEQFNTNNALLTNFDFNRASNLSINYNTLFGLTFNKSSTNVNLNIFYQRTSLNANDTYAIVPDANNSIFPEMMFTFVIYGIPKDHDNKNWTRLIM